MGSRDPSSLLERWPQEGNYKSKRHSRTNQGNKAILTGSSKALTADNEQSSINKHFKINYAHQRILLKMLAKQKGS